VSATPQLRIGELGQRVGASPTLLRAWERRYGLLQPVRSPAGYRLYGADDERRVRAMQALLADGVSAREAAAVVLQGGGPPSTVDTGAGTAEAAREQLARALARYDDAAAQAVLDRLLAGWTARAVIGEVVVPYLRELGERWAAGTASVAEEHFATSVIRGRLLGLARGWDAGRGPRAMLACPGGELHDLGLLCFGIVLRGHGWRITYLGADTPSATLREAADRLGPNVVVLAATTPASLEAAADGIAELAPPLALAGRGATQQIADRLGARLLDQDPVAAADLVAGVS
jgi:MerR family transcriptional regulator, light-induced transcriptional regulator